MKNEAKVIAVLKSLPLFAEHFLKIRTKSGRIDPFLFNRAQLFLHQRLETQLEQMGCVRAIVLKGRQGGCSTYVQARYFHKVATQRGKKAFILTHEAEATKNLFEMTKRYYDLMEPGVIPVPDTSSAKNLNFKALNSGYSVGTAGNKAVGRSQTIQLMHASEVAYYPHAEEHAKGILQAVSNEPGTEIIMESTANGLGNYFYNVWQSAVSGESDFQAIFLPWYWQMEYTAAMRESDASLSDEENELYLQHSDNGLTLEHLYWRRRKLHEFSNDYLTANEQFKVEYPMTALDAFRNPVANRFIKSHLVLKARKNKVDSQSPLVIGVDPAIGDHDRTAIIRRRGRYAYNLETFFNYNTMEIVGLIRKIIERENPAKICIDSIGVGSGVCDRLLELGYDIVEPVCVSRTANEKDKFKNQRAELWHDMREWLAQEMLVEIPDSDELMGDLTSLGYKYDSSGRLQIESKDDLRGRGIKSPDCFIAGTLVTTPRGKSAIESLKEGDFVCTPKGARRIIKVWKSETTNLTTLTFSNKKTLTGRPTHKIFTWSRGWVTMDALAFTDRFEQYSWLNQLKWKFLSLLYTTSSSFDFKHRVDIIQQTKKLSRKDFFTGISGISILEKLKKATTSTIKTVTGLIIDLRTLNPLRAMFTGDCICLKEWPILNLDERQLKGKEKPFLKRQNGTDLNRGFNGTPSMAKKHGKIEKKAPFNAPLAPRLLKHFLKPESRPDSALEAVNKKVVTQDKKQSLKNALFAKPIFWLTNIGMLSAALKSAQTESVSPTIVYNLTLESENVYYANDVLVANCADALALTFSVGNYLTTGGYQSNFMPAKAKGMFT